MAKRKAVNTLIMGIKCDNPDCDFADMTVKFEDYPHWVNKPCPKCGTNLLTKHDYYVCKILTSLTNKFNNQIDVSDDLDEEMSVVTVDLNGTDKVSISVEEQHV